MYRCRVNRKGLERKLRAMANASPEAGEAAVKIMTERALRKVLERAPRDTARYVRGWAQAGNAAGIGGFLVPPLQKAKWFDTILRAIRKEERKWAHIVASNQREGRSDKWTRRAERNLERAREQVARFDRAPEGAVIGFNILGGKRAPTIRHTVYGGDGRVFRVGNRTYVSLHNKEPHATLVEWRYGLMREAQRDFRGVGLRYGGKAYTKKINAAAAAAG
jgi:hypothetical protein